MDLSDAGNIMDILKMLWRLAHHLLTPQHTNALNVMPVISEFQFTFLMEVCLDSIRYFLMIYATDFFFQWIPS